jgi:hypothetical protein
MLRFRAKPFPRSNSGARLLLFGLVLRLLRVCGDLDTLARVALVERVVQARAEDRLKAGLAAADASALVLVVGQAQVALARLQGRHNPKLALVNGGRPTSQTFVETHTEREHTGSVVVSQSRVRRQDTCCR